MSAVILTLILGTATPGGGFPLYGEAFAEMVNAQEPLLLVEPRNTKGSTENVPLLEAGRLDIALVAGEIATAALARPGTPLRIVAAMYSSPGLFIVRGDSPYRGIADLKASRWCSAPRLPASRPSVKRFWRVWKSKSNPSIWRRPPTARRC